MDLVFAGFWVCCLFWWVLLRCVLSGGLQGA